MGERQVQKINADKPNINILRNPRGYLSSLANMYQAQMCRVYVSSHYGGYKDKRAFIFKEF